MDGDIGQYSPRLYDEEQAVFPVPQPPPVVSGQILGRDRPSHKREQTLTRRVSFSDTNAVDTNVLERLHRWMLGWAIVEFDLDNGVSGMRTTFLDELCTGITSALAAEPLR